MYNCPIHFFSNFAETRPEIRDSRRGPLYSRPNKKIPSRLKFLAFLFSSRSRATLIEIQLFIKKNRCNSTFFRNRHLTSDFLSLFLFTV